MTLVYRQEYLKVQNIGEVPPVLLPQEWLLEQVAQIAPTSMHRNGFSLLAHCTEKTNAPDSTMQWVSVFSRFGLKLELVASGCCGMSGTYGHESRNLETSKTIYAQSWQR